MEKEIICYDCGFYSDDINIIENCKKDKDDNFLCPQCNVPAFVKDIVGIEENVNIQAYLRVLTNFSHI